jgi:hypothetical protein
MPTYRIVTSQGTFEVEANRQPTQEEAEQLVSGDAIGKARLDLAAKAEKAGVEDMARSVGLELGGSVVGGLMGSVLGPVGTFLGSAAGGAAGNYLNQLVEVSKGQRGAVSGGQVAGSAAMGLIGGGAGKVVQAAKGYAAPMLARATQGGLAGASSVAVEKAIDEGRLPTWEEVSLPAAFGAVSGGALGAIEKRYATAGNLITNNAAAQAAQVGTGLGVGAYVWNDATEKGEKDALAKAAVYGAAAYGATHLPSLAARMDKQEARRIVAGPEAIAGKQTVLLANETQNKLKANEDQARRIGNWLNESISKTKDPKAMTADVLSVLDGNASPNILPKDMQQYANEFRRLNVENSDLILSLYPHLAPGLRNTIDRNKGTYIRTAYAAHDPRAKRGVDFDVPAKRDAYRKELSDDIEQNAKAVGSSISRDEAERQADVIMARMLDDVAYVGSGNIPIGVGTSPTSALQRKHDLSPAAREWMGEFMDPGERITQTLKAQSRLIIQEQHDRQLADMLKTAGIATANSKGDPNMVLLIKDDNPTYHKSLAGLFVPRHFADAYKEILSPNLIGDGAVAKNWMKLTTFSKAMKTVGNLAESVAPQVVGGLALAASSFKANPLKLIDGARKAWADAGWKGGAVGATERINMARELRELKELGITRGGAEARELQAFLDMSTKAKDGDSLLEKFSKVYGYPDTAIRYAIYKSNVDELISFRQGKAITQDEMKEIKKQAARITNDQFPTYELIPRRLRQASALSLANSFGAFEFEVMRNSVHQLRYATKLLKEGTETGNYAMTKAGAARLLSLGSVAAATAGLAVEGSRRLGTDEKTAKAANNILPTFDANKANIIKFNEDGTLTYVPINYLAPYANSLATINEALNGRNPLPYAKTMVLGDDLGPLATPAIELITNTYYGTKVPITERRDNAALVERFLSRAFVPQFITGTLSRAEKAAKGEVSTLGAVYNFDDQLKRLVGVRANTYDPIKMAQARIRDITLPMLGDLSGYRKTIKDKVDDTTGTYRDINEDAIYRSRAAGYAEGQKALSQLFLDLQTISKKTGKFGDNEIIEAFKEAGVPARLITSAAFGVVSPMPRGIQKSDTELVEEVMADPNKKKDPMGFLMASAGNDPIKIRRLSDTFEQYVRNSTIKADPITKLMGSLGIGDGERAEMIDRVMESYAKQPNGLRAAEALRDRLIGTKVITPEVYYQMLQLNEKRRASP